MVLIITQILGGNLGKNNVGFRHFNLTYRSAIALMTIKAIAVLKLNQRQDSDRTDDNKSDRNFKV
jgi:hypothetical protein